MKRRFYIRIFALLFALITVLSCFPLAAFANSVVPEDIETSDVMDDLKKMEAYSEKRYNVDETVDYCEIIDLIEFGYDYYGATSDYGLYLYVYNPSCKVIDITQSYYNRIQLRVAPANEAVAGGDTPWEKYSLVFLDKTSNNLFYKFKINVPNSYMRKPDKDRRIYEIADLEFVFDGSMSPRSVGASGKWIYTGFQEYHGSNRESAISSLYWDSTSLMTLELELQDASWKTKTSDKGEGWQHELSSVYFSVPDKIIKDYGNPDDVYKGLREVSGVYDNGKIHGISTSDTQFYEELKLDEGANPNNEVVDFGFCTKPVDYDKDYQITNFGFNIAPFPAQFYLCNTKVELTVFGNTFKGTSEGITETSLREQIEALYKSGKLLRKDDGTYGYNYYFNIKTDSSESGDIANKLKSFASNYKNNWIYSWFTKNPIYQGENYDGIEPIVVVDEGYVTANKDSACGEKYFICEDDSKAFCNYVKNNATGHSTFLMRFAVTDYYNSDIFVARKGSGNDIGYGNGNYYFEKEIFLNFDILSLTWENKNGIRTVLPVKASPINIVGNVSTTPPSDGGLPGIVGGVVDGVTNTVSNVFGCAKALTDLRPTVLLFGILIIFVLLSCIPGFWKLMSKFFSWLFSLPGKAFEAGKKRDERKDRKRKERIDRQEERDKKKERKEKQRRDAEEKVKKAKKAERDRIVDKMNEILRGMENDERSDKK